MDAFYASVEQRDNPDLRGKPIAVGGSRERGVVAAASYEARKYGVRSAMASSIAARKCPNLLFVPPRFEAYKEVSQQIRAIFHEYTDLVEPLALDEAYLDVTENKKGIEFAMDVADEIRARIFKELNLTASAGISFNKFLAKVASDIKKPNGSYVVTPGIAMEFIGQLPIEKFFGVGKVTAQKMHDKGIFNGLQLREQGRTALIRWFGKAGSYYYHVSRGIDNRAVNPNRIRKSLGAERTYEMDITVRETLLDRLSIVADTLIKRLETADAYGKTLTLKAKYSDFQQITRSHTLTKKYTNDTIRTESVNLMNAIPEIEKGIRLIGLQVSNFGDGEAEDDNSSKDVFMGQLKIDF